MRFIVLAIAAFMFVTSLGIVNAQTATPTPTTTVPTSAPSTGFGQ